VEEQAAYYLILARLAIAYLAVQATFALSQRVFSMASSISNPNKGFFSLANGQNDLGAKV
jgi:hypothetical protein